MTGRLAKLAILWRGDRAMRDTATPQNNRFRRVFEELEALGIAAEPAVYDEAFESEVEQQLQAVDGVLVWVNPLQDGVTRAALDRMLRRVADGGPWVSTHPDTILKLGTKEVLYRTRTMSWGSDVALYRTVETMCAELPARLAAGPRVVKRSRGNGGQGVWKLEALTGASEDPMVRVLEAAGDRSEEMRLSRFLDRCIPYFQDGGVIDQPFQARLGDGTVRCYMAVDRCAGFGHHKVKALVEAPEARAEAGPRLYSSNEDPRFQPLRRLMEDAWVPELSALLEIPRRDLPMIWDADFLYGPRSSSGEDSYVLCEINVSSVFPIPDEAPAAIAQMVRERLRQAAATR